MSMIDDMMEEFDVITPKGDAYGKITAALVKEYPFTEHTDFSPYYSLISRPNEKMQEYDILRRKEDGKTFRITSIDKRLLGKGFVAAKCQQYEIWDN